MVKTLQGMLVRSLVLAEKLESSILHGTARKERRNKKKERKEIGTKMDLQKKTKKIISCLQASMQERNKPKFIMTFPE